MQKVLSSHITFARPLSQQRKRELRRELLDTLDTIDTTTDKAKEVAREFKDEIGGHRSRAKKIRNDLRDDSEEFAGVYHYLCDFSRGVRSYILDDAEVHTEPLTDSDRQTDMDEDLATNKKREGLRVVSPASKEWKGKDGANWRAVESEDGKTWDLYHLAFPSDIVGTHNSLEEAEADVANREVPEKMSPDVTTSEGTLNVSATVDTSAPAEKVTLKWTRIKGGGWKTKDSRFHAGKTGSVWFLFTGEPGSSTDPPAGPFKALADAKVFAQASIDNLGDVGAAWAAVEAAGGTIPEEVSISAVEEDPQPEEKPEPLDVDDAAPQGVPVAPNYFPTIDHDDVIQRRMRNGVTPFDWIYDAKLLADVCLVSAVYMEAGRYHVAMYDGYVLEKSFTLAKEAKEAAEASFSNRVFGPDAKSWHSGEWVAMPF